MRHALVAGCLCTLVAGVPGCTRDRAGQRGGASSSAVTLGDPSGDPSGAVATRSTTGSDQVDAGSVEAAVAVLHDYFAAIGAHDYRRASDAWERDEDATGRRLAALRAEFAGITSVTADIGTPGRIEGAAGSRYVEIPVRLTTRSGGAGVQQRRRTYVLRRAVVPGASLEQRRWHIYSMHTVPAGSP